MERKQIKTINTVSRWGVGFLFIYHGLVPKIVWLSPVEIELVQLSGFAVDPIIFSPIAGVAEIIFGMLIIYARNFIVPVYLAAAALIVLLVYSAVVMPSLLVQAFNPVSTNILGLFLCYIITLTQQDGDRK